MRLRSLLTLLGFLFVWVWILFDNFGYAILCLVGAAIFYGIGSVIEGELDLGDVQSRFQRSSRRQ